MARLVCSEQGCRRFPYSGLIPNGWGNLYHESVVDPTIGTWFLENTGGTVERVRPRNVLGFGIYRGDPAVEISDEVES
jgi:hypothetical protein